MSAKLDFSFERSFRSTSEQGITLHWMKAIYGSEIDDAITNGVQLLYYPQVLAALTEDGDEIHVEVMRSRLIFQERLQLSKGTPSSESTIPNRVEFSFSQSFERESRKGKTFAWLVETYEGKADDAVLEALCLIYLPAALAASPATASRAQREAKCSRLIFEEKMTGALLQTRPSKVLLSFYPKGDRPEAAYLSDAEDFFPPQSMTDLVVPFEEPTEVTAEEDVAEEVDDDDDDYEPPEYDLDFGNDSTSN